MTMHPAFEMTCDCEDPTCVDPGIGASTCNAAVTDYGRTRRDVREIVKQQGWKTRPGLDLCPDCSADRHHTAQRAREGWLT